PAEPSPDGVCAAGVPPTAAASVAACSADGVPPEVTTGASLPATAACARVAKNIATTTSSVTKKTTPAALHSRAPARVRRLVPPELTRNISALYIPRARAG